MSRARSAGPAASFLVQDDNNRPLPVMVWGQVHVLGCDESTPDRNTLAFHPDCGVISVIVKDGWAHVKQGGSGVDAATTDAYLPPGMWHELPLFEGEEWDYLSVVSATGEGALTVQVMERVEA